MKVSRIHILNARIAAPGTLLLLGISWRLIWLARQHPFELKGAEALNAAITFAHTGLFADAIAPGEGLTAHLNPVMPIISGVVYRLMGVQTPSANWLLSIAAMGFSLGSAMMLYRSFGLMGASRSSRLLGLALYCLLPLAPFTELIEFRHWEGGLAIFLATSLLYLIVETDVSNATDWFRRCALALVAAILFFINLPLGLAGYTMCLLLLVRKLEWRDSFKTVAMATLVLTVVLTPWTIRNYQAYGTFTPLRNNAGLELALANHQEAFDNPNHKAAFLARLRDIHPNNNPRIFLKMNRLGGEGNYSKILERETFQWILGHPFQFVRLMIRHCAEFYFPPSWLWSLWSGNSQATMLKLFTTWISAFLGLIGAFCAIFIWRRNFVYAAALALIPVLPYLVVQPIIRYRFSVIGILFFLAAEFILFVTRYFTGSLLNRRIVGAPADFDLGETAHTVALEAAVTHIPFFRNSVLNAF